MMINSEFLNISNRQSGHDMEWVLPIETKLGERLERRIDSRWEVNGRSLGQNQYVNCKRRKNRDVGYQRYLEM